MKFKQALTRFNITPTVISFETIPEVKNELNKIEQSNNVDLEELMREIVDDFILNQPD